MPGGTDPIPGGGHGPWVELDLVNGFTGTLEYRHAPGSPGDDSWELEWRGHIEGISDTYCGILPADDRPPSDKYGITEGEDADTGDGIVVEYYIEASTGFVFITYPIGGGSSGGGGGTGGYIMIQDQKAQNTVAGTFTSGAWRKRDLNTTVVDDDSNVVSLSSSVLVLVAGTYRVKARCPAYACGQHQTRLQNTTDATTLVLGGSSYTAAATDATGWAHLDGEFTIGASKNIELQHYCNSSGDFGVRANITTEVFSILELIRTA